jgi:hypothetical protein
MPALLCRTRISLRIKSSCALQAGSHRRPLVSKSGAGRERHCAGAGCVSAGVKTAQGMVEVAVREDVRPKIVISFPCSAPPEA